MPLPVFNVSDNDVHYSYHFYYILLVLTNREAYPKVVSHERIFNWNKLGLHTKGILLELCFS
jgi:hypothetical protein